jgi:hypothetical protein
VPLLFLLGHLLLISIFLSVLGVEAQCGSEASSCKNCHEVQGQDPVNSDGTGWHESHAFGDFCYICHAGNQQAVEADVAHVGMVPPLSDLRASCQSCHPNDLQAKAAVYTAILGVSVESGVDSEPLAPLATAPISTEAAATEQAAVIAAPLADTDTADCPVSSIGNTELAVDDPNFVDYEQHYNQVVLGEYPVNWGDLALVGMIGLVVLGGGGFVVFNEMRLGKTAEHTARIEGEYPADVVEMLPAITNLKAQSRQSLKNILEKPEKSDQVLGLIDAVVSDDEAKE